MDALDVLNQDALWTERAVVQALGVRVLQRLGNVAHELQALRDGAPRAVVTQQVIQAHSLGVVVEHERWAQLGFFVVLDLQDARVVDAFEHLEFAACLAHARCASLRAGGGGHGVDAHAAVHGLDGDVVGFPILEAFAFGQQRAELVIADLAVFVGGSNAGLVEAARDGAGLLCIDRRCAPVSDATRQCADDAIVVC